MLRTPPPTALGTYFLVVTTQGVKKLSPNLFGIGVQSSYGSDVWLQGFSGSAVPANTAVPLFSVAVAANSRNVGPSFFPLGLKINDPGLVLVASSTQETLTAAAAATLDITVFIEEFEFPVSPTDAVSGDLTTGVKKLQVWADSAGPKNLRRAIVINNAVVDRYVCIYAADAAGASDKIISWQKILASSAIELDYGTVGGFSPLQRDSNGTIKDGCTIQGQTTLTPGDIVAASDFNIKAYSY